VSHVLKANQIHPVIATIDPSYGDTGGHYLEKRVVDSRNQSQISVLEQGGFFKMKDKVFRVGEA